MQIANDARTYNKFLEMEQEATNVDALGHTSAAPVPGSGVLFNGAVRHWPAGTQRCSRADLRGGGWPLRALLPAAQLIRLTGSQARAQVAEVTMLPTKPPGQQPVNGTGLYSLTEDAWLSLPSVQPDQYNTTQMLVDAQRFIQQCARRAQLRCHAPRCQGLLQLGPPLLLQGLPRPCPPAPRRASPPALPPQVQRPAVRLLGRCPGRDGARRARSARLQLLPLDGVPPRPAEVQKRRV